AQDLLGVSEDRIVGRVALVEIALVVGRVNDGLSSWQRRGHAVLREATAHAEDDVGLREERVNGAGHHAAAPGAEGQRVILRERALALEGGHDRSLQELGELEKLR